ncbi:diguanylate cyclase [Thioalkalivibrio versutus]|uniref:diguanylate cyclase n=1 Tax=Thioalkalivibrio versutus TaxID=106634 RepID=UPI0009872465|nr:diguanylate cyclase [Thioalkalivibrio versutus]OOC48486.1 response regulator receiver protein [Thioalkalivibrio versutus]
MTPTDAEQALTTRLEELRSRYLERLPDEFAELSALQGRLSGQEQDRDVLDELQQRLHKLAGSGGSFGCASLSIAARSLEQRIGAWLEAKELSLDAPTRRSLMDEIEALSRTVPERPERPERPAFRVAPEARTTSDNTLEVWLVEDNAELCRQLQQQLESFNYEVRVFRSIDELKGAMESRQPDLLLVDVMLEQGRENATERLVDCPQVQALDCPLIFLSANDDFPSRVRAVQLGAQGYFLKPLDVPRLVSRISQIFQERHAPAQRVLIVDDDADLAEHMRLVLTAAGMEAWVLDAPREIMETIAAFRPELVLMDLYMPEYAGTDLAGVIRQHEAYTHLPIVYLSAETDIERQIDAMGRGADDFLTKPISDLQLVAAARARVARARQLEERINKDSLTGLLKHASIKEAANREVLRARRIGRPVTLAMLDIDHFKVVNDTYGHAVGDVVISSIATLLRQRLRQSDIIGRYGGGEFVAVLPECEAEHARRVLEDIRRNFASLDFGRKGERFGCTISIGMVCSADYPDQDGPELLVAADEALYKAKRGGRNQVQQGVPAHTREVTD